jgi:transposase
MSEGVRILRPDRVQLRWDITDLDTQLPPDHRARMIWDFVIGLDLSAFVARIKARDDQAGRPASDPAVLLALWLYATIEGIGSARAVERLCDHHAAYRWLCGGVPVNHNLLCEFRRDSGVLLDTLLTQSLTGMIAEGLVTLEEVAIDGTKVNARASRGSMAGDRRLTRIEAVVAERVASLKKELEQGTSGAERQRQERALRAAKERAARIARARERLGELDQEKAERAKRHAKEEAKKGAPKVSVSDPEVRMMRMADGAVRPAWNVQVATANGFIVTVEATDRRKDSGLAEGLVAQIKQRYGRAPVRLLADATAITQGEIARFAKTCPDLDVYSPLPEERTDVTLETLRKRRWQRKQEPTAVKAWRTRMASEAGQEVYRRRKLTEHAHAKMKNRGFGKMPLHGLVKVQAVCLLHALAHNAVQAQYRRKIHAA